MGKIEHEPLLTPAELATKLRVDVKTTSRWAKQGKLHTQRTLGGHRRFFENEVNAWLRGEAWDPPEGITLETEQRAAA
jgi:excisionase family DNA binding protein